MIPIKYIIHITHSGIFIPIKYIIPIKNDYRDNPLLLIGIMGWLFMIIIHYYSTIIINITT